MKFEWSDKKNKLNQRKHGVDFADSWSVFEDEHAILKSDPDNSEDEDRFVLLGMNVALKILVVFFCERHEDTIRIFSARKANKNETELYERRYRK